MKYKKEDVKDSYIAWYQNLSTLFFPPLSLPSYFFIYLFEFRFII